MRSATGVADVACAFHASGHVGRRETTPTGALLLSPEGSSACRAPRSQRPDRVRSVAFGLPSSSVRPVPSSRRGGPFARHQRATAKLALPGRDLVQTVEPAELQILHFFEAVRVNMFLLFTDAHLAAKCDGIEVRAGYDNKNVVSRVLVQPEDLW